MDNLQPRLDESLAQLIAQTTSFDVHSDDLAKAATNLEALSKIRALLPDPDPDPTNVPVTPWEKVKTAAASVWDNETTRVLIKAGGAFGGVALVVWSSVIRDHNLERNALTQANQRNS